MKKRTSSWAAAATLAAALPVLWISTPEIALNLPREKIVLEVKKRLPLQKDGLTLRDLELDFMENGRVVGLARSVVQAGGIDAQVMAKLSAKPILAKDGLYIIDPHLEAMKIEDTNLGLMQRAFVEVAAPAVIEGMQAQLAEKPAVAYADHGWKGWLVGHSLKDLKATRSGITLIMKTLNPITAFLAFLLGLPLLRMGLSRVVRKVSHRPEVEEIIDLKEAGEPTAQARKVT